MKILKISSLISLFSMASCQSMNKAQAQNQPLICKENVYPAHWWKSYNDPNKPSWEILPDAAATGEVILSKRNELGLLSNFAATEFTYNGKKYASIEGLWQGSKYPENDKDPRATFPGVKWDLTRDQVNKMTAFDAKNAGKQADENMKKMGIDWVTFDGKQMKYRENAKGDFYNVIRAAMKEKLNQNSMVKEVLLATGSLKLKPDHDQGPDAAPAWRYYEIWTELRSEIQ